MSENLDDSGGAVADATAGDSASDGAGAAGDEADEPTARLDELRAQVDVLEEENRRLRAEYARARQTQYRRTGLALGLIGALAGGAALLYPGARTVLFALAGTGLFLGVLVFYLTPEAVVPATVGEEVYTALATNETAVATELGLSTRRWYVPDVPGDHAVRLYVPQRTDAALPDPTALRDTFVVDEPARGVAFRPSGLGLVEEFDRAVTGDLADEPAGLGAQLLDGLVEQFELVDSGETDAPADADAEAGRLTVAVSGSAYGAVDRFDHPVVSFVAVGVASGLGTPVSVETTDPEDGSADYLVTCRWPVDGEDSA